MLTKDKLKPAVEALLEMFKKKEYPQQLAFSIIKKSADEADKPSDKWSIGNKMLMWLCGGTDDARGYKQWLEVGRHVRKGGKAFAILAPTTKTIEDEDTKEKKTIVTGFRPIPVFALEATEGKELAAVDYKPPELPPLIDVAEKMGISVRWKPMSKPAYGYYRPRDKSITLCSQDWFVFYHELAHACHGTYADLKTIQEKAEIVADLTAAVLCQMQGVDGYQVQTYEYVRRFCHDKTDQAVLRTILGALADVEKIVLMILKVAAQPKAASKQSA